MPATFDIGRDLWGSRIAVKQSMQLIAWTKTNNHGQKGGLSSDTAPYLHPRPFMYPENSTQTDFADKNNNMIGWILLCFDKEIADLLSL